MVLKPASPRGVGGGGWRAASKLFYRGSCSLTGMESLLAGAQENLLHNVNNTLRDAILRQAGADEAGFGILARWGYSKFKVMR